MYHSVKNMLTNLSEAIGVPIHLFQNIFKDVLQRYEKEQILTFSWQQKINIGSKSM